MIYFVGIFSFIFYPFHILKFFLVPRKHILHSTSVPNIMYCKTHVSVDMHPYTIQLTTISLHCLHLRNRGLIIFCMILPCLSCNTMGRCACEDISHAKMKILLPWYYILSTLHGTWSTANLSKVIVLLLSFMCHVHDKIHRAWCCNCLTN
jgi:hypothetical protein